MAYDDEDLFEEEFDFGDEDEDSETDDSEADDSEADDSEADELDSDVEKEEPAKPKRRSPRSSSSKGDAKRGAKKPTPAASQEDDEFAAEVDEPEEPEVAAASQPSGPPTDHVVQIYEFGNYKRTIPREFTDEDAIKFAEEFNRTSRNYGRHAVPAERDEEPDPHL